MCARRASRAYLSALREVGLDAMPVGASGLQLAPGTAGASAAGLRRGRGSVQDAAAQLAAPLLLKGLTPGIEGAPLRVLDACAAPGGKTAHLLELAGAADRGDGDRGRRRAQPAHRRDPGPPGPGRRGCGVGRCRPPGAWWDGVPFDAILLDAPCTASGIVRRHPDVRWLRRESDTAQLALQQAMLLAALWPLVRPGGRLLYCTCSVFREEGSHQIEAFLAHNTDARLRPSPGHLLPQSGANADGVPDNPSVTTTASSTHCSKRPALTASAERLDALEDVISLAALVCRLGCCRRTVPARAQSAHNASVTQMRLERSDDGVYLVANVDFQLPTLIQEVLDKGIAIHFVAEAEVFRERWYWTDRRVAHATRQLRLAFQPLTRRWRVNVVPTNRQHGTRAWSSTRISTRSTTRSTASSASAGCAWATSATSPRTRRISWCSASGSTRRNCRDRSRSAWWAWPTGTSRSSAARAWPWRSPMTPGRGASTGPVVTAEGAPRAALVQAVRWAIGVIAALVTAIGLVLMFLLALATNNRVFYEENYTRLFGINVVVATLLLLVIGWVAVRLVRRLRQGKFGSRLLIKLAAIFALVGVVPGVLVYFVSYQFVSRSIESWFDVKVEGALDAGLNLGRATLDSLADDLAVKTRAASGQLSQVADASAGLALERIRDQLGASDVVLWTGTGQLVAGAGHRASRSIPSGRRSSSCAGARRATHRPHRGAGRSTDGAGRFAAGGRRAGAGAGAAPGLRIQHRAALPAGDGAVAAGRGGQCAGGAGGQSRIPGTLARARRPAAHVHRHAHAVPVPGRLRRRAAGGAVRQRPRAAAAGAGRWRAPGRRRRSAADGVLQGKDELGGLTRSFAVMTQQLADARAAVEKTVGELDAARGNLQTILDNLTSGVIVLDAAGTVLSTNPGATRVLRAPLAAYEGRPLRDVPGLADFAQNVQQQFDDFEVERIQHGLDHWQHAFELRASSFDMEQDAISLVARGAELPGAERLLVFDDISEIASAQRAQAWGEVARRLAHEIKNPLTPIQLSAERLEMKLVGQGRAAGAGDPHQVGQDHRRPGRRHEAAGQRIPRLRAPARGRPEARRSQCAGDRRAAALRRRHARPWSCAANSTNAARRCAAMPSRSARSSTTCCRTPRTPPRQPWPPPAGPAKSRCARAWAIPAGACV